MNIIETKNLTKYYGKHRGIIDINLQVEEGEIFGFIGPNGAGKSTTIRTLMNFISPTSGSAYIFNKDCQKQSSYIKKSIGYLPSEVNYYDDLNAQQLFQYSAKYYHKECTARIRELSEYFELDVSKRLDEMSFGNKKKVGIIQALLHKPKLLILDEPTGGLDPLMQNRFFDLLENENKAGTTILFSSHLLSEVQRMCNRVAIIKEGHLLKVERVETLREEKYKKVKILLSNPRENIESLSEIGENVVISKNKVEFMYKGKSKELLQRLNAIECDNIWIEDPSLEEIFMHYYL